MEPIDTTGPVVAAPDTPSIDNYKLDTRFSDSGVHHATGEWKQKEKIGGGGLGSAWLQEEVGTSKLRAVKKLSRDMYINYNLDFMLELRTLIRVQDHRDKFIELFGWFEDRDFMYLAMGFAVHGNLEQYIEHSPIEAKVGALKITAQLLEGLLVLHGRHICHFNLKPQNILIDSLSPIHVKLTDFGTPTTVMNNPRVQIYKAPEILGLLPRSLQSGEGHSTAMDMWSLGCLLHLLLASKPPFVEDSIDMYLLSQYCRGEASFPTHMLRELGVSDRAIDLIGKLLVPNPGDRYSAAGALNHRWISDIPSLFDQQNSSEIVRTQFLSVGLEIGLDTASRLVSACRYRRDIDICGYLSPPMVKDKIVGALRAAASKGFLLVVELLMRCSYHGAGYNIHHTGLVLSAALKDNDVVAVQSLLDAGAYTDTLIPIFCSAALQQAAGGGYLTLVRILLEGGVDVNAEPAEKNGSTALEAAARGGHVGVVMFLLERGANPNTTPRTPYGQTALRAAAGGGHLEVVTLLLEKGTNVNAAPSDRTALQAAAEGGHLEVVKLLLENGANVNANPAHERGRTALQAAAQKGHHDVVVLLLQKGANVNADPSRVHGHTALQAAAGGGHLEVVKLLLENGANVNANPAHERGRTALQAAAQKGHHDVVILLLQKGADVNDNPARVHGRTALQAAAEGGHFRIVILLLHKGADVNANPSICSGLTALQAAAGRGHLEMVILLLEKNAYINAGTCECCSGVTALQAAGMGGHLNVVIFLLEKGANVNQRYSGWNGRTALQAAAGGGHLEVVRLLLDTGADVNAGPIGIHGLTALHAAAQKGHVEVVRLLLERQADVNVWAGAPRRTALGDAMCYRYLEVESLLRSAMGMVGSHDEFIT